MVLADGLAAYDLAGTPVAAPRLDPEAPLLVLSDGPAPVIGDTVMLGPQSVVADSFDQFTYPGGTGDGFDRFVRAGETRVDFILGLGQQTNGVPWTPYLTTERDGWVRLEAGFGQPSMWDGVPVEIVHAFTAPEAMTLALEARVAPYAETSDGVSFALLLGGAPLAETVVQSPAVLAPPPVTLAAGEVLEIVLGPGESPDGDATDFRFTLRRAD